MADLLALTATMEDPRWLFGAAGRYGPLGTPVRTSIARAAFAGTRWHCYR